MRITKERSRKKLPFIERVGEIAKWIRKSPFGRIGLQFFLLFLAFAAGVFLYREGILHKLRDRLITRPIEQVEVIIEEVVEEVKEDVTEDVMLYQGNNLETLYLDIPFDSLQTIQEKRDEALETGILLASDEDFVNAQLHFQDGDQYRAKIRLKGDWADHFEGEKWSYRIHVRDDGHVLGMRRFSIQAPETRNFLAEWAFHQHLMQEGVLTTRYHFVNVVINGEFNGIYALEESFAEELLESQGRREGLIIRFNEDLLWSQRSYMVETFGQLPDSYSSMLYDFESLQSAEIDTFRSGHIAVAPELTQQAETAYGLLKAFQTNELTDAEILDVEITGRYLAVADLWDSSHSWFYWHNLRFYFNPVTGLMEPVAFDGMSLIDFKSPIQNHHILRSPEVREVYIRELWRMSQPGYLDAIWGGMEGEYDLIYNSLLTEYEPDQLLPIYDLISQRQKTIQSGLQPIMPIRGTYMWTEEGSVEAEGGPGGNLQVTIVNLVKMPVDILNVRIGEEIIKPSLDWTLEGGEEYLSENGKSFVLPSNTLNKPVKFVVPTNGIAFEEMSEDEDPPVVEVTVQIKSLPQIFTIPVLVGTIPDVVKEGPRPIQPGIAEVLETHPFLSSSEDLTSLSVLPGMWEVTGDLVIPEGVELNILPGTTLLFEEDAVLFSTTPVYIWGEEGQPVSLTAQSGTWGGMVILNANGKSMWHYAVVENTAGISREGWMTTGGITFYESALEIYNSKISGSKAEDAINVIRADFTFDHLAITSTVSDAFDGDFVTGRIIDSSFINIGGDAVDVSGSDISIQSTKMIDIGDKGLSAGENSEVNVRGLTIENAGIGIASKDLSRVYASNIVLSEITHAAMAAFIKKSEYGPSTIEVSNLQIVDTGTEAIVQTECIVIVDGKQLITADIDVDALYEQGILGN